MANSSDKWYFTKEQLENTPSRKCGYDSFKELSYRQQTANFIQDMGQRLKVSQLCINTAIVYMHRFYVFHSFTHFPWHQMAAAALFLAAKVEEQPRKLEYVIRVANICRNNKDNLDSEKYQAQSQDLVFNENVLLQTLGFDVAIDHPHTHVVRCCHLVRASKSLSQCSYFLASNSLHLTTMCLQYKPTVVACFCIHLACKWSRWEIPLSSEKKEWFLYVDQTVTAELLQQLTAEFFSIFESCPSRLKDKIMSIGDNGMHAAGANNTIINSPFDTDPKKLPPLDPKDDPQHKHRSSSSLSASSSQQQREREYREKKEREKLAQQGLKMAPPFKQAPSSSHGSSGHHRPVVDAKMKQHQSMSSSSRQPHPRSSAEPRDILREVASTSSSSSATRDGSFGLANNSMQPPSSRDHTSSKISDNKDVVLNKRDYLLKPNVAASLDSGGGNSNSNSNNFSFNGDKTSRSSSMPTSNRSNSSNNAIDPNKVPIKHEQVRRHDDKLFNKSSDSDKRQQQQQTASVPGHDRNNSSSNSYLNKSLNSTSQQQNKNMPLTMNSSSTTHQQQQLQADSKSVLKLGGSTSHQQQQQHVKHHHNGNSNYNNAHHLQQHQMKEEKDDAVNSLMKRPSLFSPEKSPPKLITTHQQQQDTFSSLGLSPLQTPPQQTKQANKRERNYLSSSGSEPELRPVMKKIDQVEGFENLLRDSSIGINKLHQIPDIITPITDAKDELPSYVLKEMKPPDIIPPLSCDNNVVVNNLGTTSLSQPIVNGIETNPVLISSLLKETAVTPTVSHLSGVVSAASATTTTIIPKSQDVVSNVPQQQREKDHHHHKSKKKNKEKHKHKDKDREKKKKHKDKDREKHKHKHDGEQQQLATEPIKIKIQKDKIQLPQQTSASATSSSNNPLRIKIPKDVIKTETNNSNSNNSSNATNSGGSSNNNSGGDHYSSATGGVPSVGLKIKIPRDKINNCEMNNSTASSSEKSRKRDRSSPGDGPPGKFSKSISSSSSSNSMHHHKESKQNGRHSSYNNKVTQLGDGDTSIHRLAESKYINKNTTS